MEFAMFKTFLSGLATVVKFFILVCLVIVIYNEAFFYLPKEQQAAIDSFCRSLSPVKFDSSAGKLYSGNACALDAAGNPMACQTAVFLDGPIGREMFESFDSALKQQQLPHRMVCLRSDGGLLKGAERIAQLIRREKLDTCVADYVEYTAVYDKSTQRFTPHATTTHHDVSCGSVCPFMLLAGTERVALGQQFNIKLHHPGTPSKTCLGTVYQNSDLSKENVLLALVQQSPSQDAAAHHFLYQRALQTNFRKKKPDIVSHTDFAKYRLFTKSFQ
jgi:hypothetical protein